MLPLTNSDDRLRALAGNKIAAKHNRAPLFCSIIDNGKTQRRARIPVPDFGGIHPVPARHHAGG